MPETMIRAARSTDVDRLRQIEADSGRRFLEFGIDVAPFGTFSREVLLAAVSTGALHVLVDDTDVAIGFAYCERLGPDGGSLHLHEIDVVPGRQGEGLGRRLLEHVVEVARAEGCRQVTLTTFRDVPFNAPWYVRRGFVVLPDDELPPWLRSIRESETAAGLDVQPRVAMARSVR